MPRLGGLLVLSLSLLAAADAPPEPRDIHGDPLPPGAVVRLGTTRFRAEGGLYKVTCTPDGAVVVSAGLAVWVRAAG